MTDGAKPRGRPSRVVEYPAIGAQAERLRAAARELSAATPQARAVFFAKGDAVAVARAVEVLAAAEGEEFFDQAERFMRLADAIARGSFRGLDVVVDEGKAHALVKTLYYIEHGSGRALGRAQDLWDRVAGPPTGHAKARAKKRGGEE